MEEKETIWDIYPIKDPDLKFACKAILKSHPPQTSELAILYAIQRLEELILSTKQREGGE